MLPDFLQAYPIESQLLDVLSVESKKEMRFKRKNKSFVFDDDDETLEIIEPERLLSILESVNSNKIQFINNPAR